jgi:dynamin 1-like protein
VLNQISIPEVDRFDILSNRIFEVIEQLLHRCLSQTDQLIQNLIEIELGYINTSHPDFVSGVDLIQKEDHHNQSDDQLQPP